MTIQKNVLHYYVDLLRMKDGEERSPEQSESCVTALHNVIRTMRFSRHDKVCGEDFSRLDFENIPFNGIHFSMDGENPCRFDGCRLNEWNFMSGHSGAVNAVAWSTDGKCILTGGDDGSVILWNSKNGLMAKKTVLNNNFTYGNRVTSLTTSHNGNYCLLGCSDSVVYLYEFKTGNIVNMTSKSNIYWIDALSFSNNDEYFIVGERGKDDKNQILIYDVKTLVCSRMIDEVKSDISSVAFSVDGKYCFASFGTRVRKYETKTGKCLNSIVWKNTDIKNIYLSPNGNYCIITYFSKRNQPKFAELWDFMKNKRLWTFDQEIDYNGCTGAVDTVTFSSDEEWCLLSESGGIIKIWNIKTGECLYKIEEKEKFITSTAISYDKKKLAVGLFSGLIKTYSINTSVHLVTMQANTRTLSFTTFFRNRKLLLIKNSSKKFPSLFDIEKKKFLKELDENNILYRISEDFEIFDEIVISNKDYLLVTRGSSNVGIILDLETGYRKWYLDGPQGHDYGIRDASFSKNGQFCITGSNDNTAKLWDFKNEKCLRTLEGHSEPVISVAISSNGKFCLTASEDKTIRIWNFEEGDCKQIINSLGNVFLVGFSDDDNDFFSFDCNTVKIWKVNTGKCLQEIHITDSKGVWNKYQYKETFTGNTYIIQKYNFFNSIVPQKPIWSESFYYLNKIYIKNSLFQNITADETVRKILYQYGGITDPDDENKS